MEITVNQQTHSVPNLCSVEQMISVLFPKTQQGIAIAVNQVIVAKTNWQNHQLQNGDAIIVIKATQGG